MRLMNRSHSSLRESYRSVSDWMLPIETGPLRWRRLLAYAPGYILISVISAAVGYSVSAGQHVSGVLGIVVLWAGNRRLRLPRLRRRAD